jgi:uncharacterized protein (TIGR03435 family)
MGNPTLWLLAAAALISWSTPIRSQPIPTTFEVASVKANRSGDAAMSFDIQPGGRLSATNIPLKQLIRAAYTLQLYQIVDAPAWIDSERFDVMAVADRDITIAAPWNPTAPFAPAQLMLQALLTDRFRMVARRDTREGQTYALVVDTPEDRRGTLRAAASPCVPGCGMQIGAGSLRARQVALPQVAELLSQLTGRLVSDETRLTGPFDLDLRWTPEAQAAGNGDAPSLFTAVREQLGLRLDARRGPVPVLVIESIERPTPD